MSGATLVFIPVAVLAVAIAVVAFGRLVAGIGLRSESDLGDAERDARRLALEGDKHRVFAQLRDLEHEYSLGKLSRDDYEGLKQHFEFEAVRILDALEKNG
jgi:hypothetical protein